MILKNAINEISGFREMIDSLELRCGLSCRMLYGIEFMRDRRRVETELGDIDRMAAVLKAAPDLMSALDLKLAQVKDIRGTAVRIEAAQTLGDIDMFEIKVFALLAVEIRGLSAHDVAEVVRIPDLSAVADILDPEHLRIPHFAVYDAYSPELAAVRRKLKHPGDQAQAAELYSENARLEDEVRQMLSDEIYRHRTTIADAMAAVARLDILIAKAKQARALNLCRPAVGEDTKYTGLFNPVVRNILRVKGKDFQPVDIEIGRAPVLITGANMGGKTVLLRTVALAQALFQYGFYVPAASARIAVVDEILTGMGDGQDETGGLSSFAAEMMKLTGITEKIRGGSDALVLLDEPARTTNPVEGSALVNAILDFLAENRVRALVTSHYAEIGSGCRKLRVKGFARDVPVHEVTVHNIHDYMDYSLTENDGHAPHEAMRVAGILGVDPQLLERAAEYLVPPGTRK